MASAPTYRNLCRLQWHRAARSLSTATSSPKTISSSTTASSATSEPSTHFKITLRRSAISLGDKKKGTLVSLGIHRRHQIVYHPHSPEVAGKILSVKELLEVESVPESLVRTKQEQRLERKAVRGYQVVGNKREAFMNVGI